MKSSLIATSISLLVLAACQGEGQKGTERPIGAVAPAASTQPVDSNAPAMIHFDQNNHQ